MVCSSTVCCWSVGSPWRPWGCPSEKGAESRVLGSPIACLGPGLERGTQRRLEEKAGEGYSEHVPLVRRTWGRRNFFGGSPTGLVLARCPVREGVTDGIPGKLPPRPPNLAAVARCCRLGRLPGPGDAPVLRVWYTLPVRGRLVSLEICGMEICGREVKRASRAALFVSYQDSQPLSPSDFPGLY